MQKVAVGRLRNVLRNDILADEVEMAKYLCVKFARNYHQANCDFAARLQSHMDTDLGVLGLAPVCSAGWQNLRHVLASWR